MGRAINQPLPNGKKVAEVIKEGNLKDGKPDGQLKYGALFGDFGSKNRRVTTTTTTDKLLGIPQKPSDPNGPRRRGHLQVQRSLLNRAYGRTKESLG